MPGSGAWIDGPLLKNTPIGCCHSKVYGPPEPPRPWAVMVMGSSSAHISTVHGSTSHAGRCETNSFEQHESGLTQPLASVTVTQYMPPMLTGPVEHGSFSCRPVHTLVKPAGPDQVMVYGA